MSSKRLICHVHDEIMKISSDIEKDTRSNRLRGLSEEELIDLLDDINTRVNDITYLAEEAKAYGQSMENRLREYFDVIEGLGFSRKTE